VPYANTSIGVDDPCLQISLLNILSDPINTKQIESLANSNLCQSIVVWGTHRLSESSVSYADTTAAVDDTHLQVSLLPTILILPSLPVLENCNVTYVRASLFGAHTGCPNSPRLMPKPPLLLMIPSSKSPSSPPSSSSPSPSSPSSSSPSSRSTSCRQECPSSSVA
jgi:hypothetical protein